jgi:hypothetical protein
VNKKSFYKKNIIVEILQKKNIRVPTKKNNIRVFKIKNGNPHKKKFIQKRYNIRNSTKKIRVSKIKNVNPHKKKEFLQKKYNSRDSTKNNNIILEFLQKKIISEFLK